VAVVVAPSVHGARKNASFSSMQRLLDAPHELLSGLVF
jgi:hypothetical protein